MGNSIDCRGDNGDLPMRRDGDEMDSSRILRFKTDTKHRKDWFTGISFSHPAKMSVPLQLWIIENYTKAGETILDPLAGSGTLMVCCSMGRNCILVELEDKFCKMIEGNWEKENAEKKEEVHNV